MAFSLQSCKVTKNFNVEVYETSAQGNSLKKITQFSESNNPVIITLNQKKNFKLLLVLADHLPKLRPLY